MDPGGRLEKSVRVDKKRFYLRAREASFPRLSRLSSFTLNRRRGISFFLAVP